MTESFNKVIISAKKQVFDEIRALKEQIAEKIIIVKVDGETYEKVACYPRMVVDNALEKLLAIEKLQNIINKNNIKTTKSG